MKTKKLKPDKSEQKDPVYVRTISSVVNTKIPIRNKVFDFMANESKKIYNTTLFHTNIFLRYQNLIFKDLLDLVNNNEILDIKQFDKMFYTIYGKYHNNFLIIKDALDNNNRIIYNHIKEYLNEHKLQITNDNYNKIYDIMIIQITNLNTFTVVNKNDMDELFFNLVQNILKSIYTKNFNEFKRCIINNIPCPNDDESFITQVKNEEYLFSKDAAKNYKKILMNHPLFISKKKDKNNENDEEDEIPCKKEETIKSNQNYIARIVYEYYTDCKIPSDLMCNIIAKGHAAFCSYFALLEKGIYAKKPSYLGKDARYILPFFIHSRKLINVDGNDHYRLTAGKFVANNFVDIIGDPDYKCLNFFDKTEYKKYAHVLDLKFSSNLKKIPKGQNYIIETKTNKGYYINKKSDRVIDSYYVFINKPPKSEMDKLVLIEVNPIYDGKWYKINFTYKTEANTNNPDPNKKLSIDFGIINLMTIYDPHGEPKIIKGAHITNMNKFYNNLTDKCKSGIAKQDPKFTSDGLKKLLLKRHHSIDNYLNNLVKWFVTTYKDYATIIVGYNTGWKKKVNMGKKMNRKFYEIPYMKLVYKLRDKLAMSNQKLEITNESYTSKCDALAFERVGFHETYNGKRFKRGLFSSHPKQIYSSVKNKMIKVTKKGILLNADVNGAINIMRKWEEKNGKIMKKITGINICNPRVIKLKDYVNIKNSQKSEQMVTQVLI